MNELINHNGVCRTAPATPGLLTKFMNILYLDTFITLDADILCNLWRMFQR